MPSDLVVRIKAETSGLLNGIRKAQSSIAGLEKQTDRTSTSFGRMLRVAAGSTAALGVAKLIKDSVTLEAAYSKTMAQVAVATNAPKSQLKSLDDLALKLGKDTVFSAQDAAQAMLELSKGGLSVAQIKAGALANTLTLASAGGLDLGEASKAVVNALGAFQLGARDTDAAVAALAGSANASSADVSDITQALAQAGTTAHSAGLSIQDTTAYLALFANQGIKGSDAGTSLRTMLSRLVPQTKQATTSMDALGLSYLDGNDNLVSATEIARRTQKAFKGLSDDQRITYTNAIFGQDAQRAVNAITAEGAEGLQKYMVATNDLTQAQKLAKAANSGTAGAIENMKGAIETAQIQIGKGLAPVIQDLAGDLGDLASSGDVEKWAHDGAQAAVDFARDMQPLAASLVDVGQNALPAIATAASATADALSVAAAVVKPFIDGFNALPETAQKALILAAGVKTLNSRMGGIPGISGPAGASLFGFGTAAEKAGKKSKKAAPQVATLGGSLKSFGVLSGATFAFSDLADQTDTFLRSLKGGSDQLDDISTSFNRNGEATAGTVKAISDAFADSNIGKYADDLGVDLDKFATDLANNGEGGAYVQQVLDDLTSRYSAFKDGLTDLSPFDFGGTESDKIGAFKNSFSDLLTTLDGVHEKAARTGEDMNNLAIDMLFATGNSRGLAANLKALPNEVKTAVLTPGALDSDKKITDLATKYKLTPKQVRTVLEAKGTAEGDIKRILSLLKQTDNANANPKVKAETKSAEDAVTRLRNLLLGIRSKTVYVNVKEGKKVNPGDIGGGTQLKAAGGAIAGPGTGTSDSIPARLSNGEHVWTAKEVAAAGGQRAMYAMRAQVLGRSQGFASGGAVGGSTGSSDRVVSVSLKGARVSADKNGLLSFVDGRVEVALGRGVRTRVSGA